MTGSHHLEKNTSLVIATIERYALQNLLLTNDWQEGSSLVSDSDRDSQSPVISHRIRCLAHLSIDAFNSNSYYSGAMVSRKVHITDVEERAFIDYEVNFTHRNLAIGHS